MAIHEFAEDPAVVLTHRQSKIAHLKHDKSIVYLFTYGSKENADKYRNLDI